MRRDKPLFLEDTDALRRDLLETDGRRASLFAMLLRSVRAAPENFAWHAPFAALVTRDPADIDAARRMVRIYMEKLEPMSFCSGLQFHFWCFAFPHAKMALAFQWLCTLGAFEPDEEERIRRRFVEYHFINFFYGLRTKPDPECVDNQVLSLALSAALVGVLFGEGEAPGETARLMRDEGLARLPGLLGAMDPSGYSGEGSSYMDCVNGPAIPLAIELLERTGGETGLLDRPFPPGGARPGDVLRMVARSFMPGGLLLPWDNYGYQFGVRSTLAYGAKKTGEPLFAWLLENACIPTYDIGIGWAYDDLPWMLAWMPTEPAPADCPLAWSHDRLGGALVSRDRLRYGALLWDDSTPRIPTRAHVNPAMVLFNGYGVPLSADGSPGPTGVPRFQFDDTWRTLHHFIGTTPASNYGDGCAGAHSVLLVDGKESMRAWSDGPQHGPVDCRPDDGILSADVTPIYRENVPDVRAVARKLQLHGDCFFTLEDLFVAEDSHRVASRFLLRPEWEEAPFGVRIRTPEGVILHLAELLETGGLPGQGVHRETVEGHPAWPDGQSRLVDFVSEGTRIRRLFVAHLACDVSEAIPVTGFQALAEDGADLPAVRTALFESPVRLDLSCPAHMEAGLPVRPTWWYGRRVAMAGRPAYLELPLGLARPALFLDGVPVDLEPWAISGRLVRPLVPIPERLRDRADIEVVLRTDVPTSHYDGDGDGTIGLYGGVGLRWAQVPDRMARAEWRDGILAVDTTGGQSFRIPYPLMEA